MKSPLSLILAAAIVAALPLATIAQDPHAAHGSADPSGAVVDAFRQANDKMMQDMMVEPTGDADLDFVRMMIPHHQGAIDMAKIELEYGKDPLLREMAQQIIDAQEAEIAAFRKWLDEKGM
jgi:uncharacterized protein (DUF305 family)